MPKFSRILCNIFVDFWGQIVYNDKCQGERLVNSLSGRCFSSRKKILKKVKKPLDKQNSIGYNKDTNKQEVATESQGGSKNFKKNKKSLDNSYYICYNKDVIKTKQNIKERKRA